jgi:hypothetical protein
MRQLTSFWIHNFLRSVPSSSGGALRPDSRPYAVSSVLLPALLRRLPWGPPDAPPRTASFLDWAQSSLYLPTSLLGKWSSFFRHPVCLLCRHPSSLGRHLQFLLVLLSQLLFWFVLPTAIRTSVISP